MRRECSQYGTHCAQKVFAGLKTGCWSEVRTSRIGAVGLAQWLALAAQAGL